MAEEGAEALVWEELEAGIYQPAAATAEAESA